MYALKIIGKNPEGQTVENVTVLGNWYSLELSPPRPTTSDSPAEVARVSHADNDNVIYTVITDEHEAYITTIEGTTVRVIRNRGAA